MTHAQFAQAIRRAGWTLADVRPIIRALLRSGCSLPQACAAVVRLANRAAEA